MTELTIMTADGRVVIPKDVRDALGIGPEERLEIFQRDGEIVIRRHLAARNQHDGEEAEVRRLRAISRKYAHLRDGRSTDEIMKEIRGDDPFPP